DGRTVTTLKAPSPYLLGFGVDPANADHVRTGDTNGRIWESKDAGATWTAAAEPPSADTYAYRVAFDPANLLHIGLGVVSNGSYVTFDGGQTWTASTGLAASGRGPVNVFNAVVSPADPRVVWVMGLDIQESDANVPSQGRHVYRSTDGGLTFAPA